MTRVLATVISPREDPFTDEVDGFWDDERTTVSAFSTGINNRDGVQCVIGNCDYNIPPYLDHCHIIQKNDKDTVSASLSLSTSLTCLI